LSLEQWVKLYQELADNAWPCKVHYLVNGWIARISEGYTQRANSVLPIFYSGMNPKEDITLVEKIYLKMKLPKVIFQIPAYTAPKNLDNILEMRDYQKCSETSVMVSKLKNLSSNPVRNDLSFKSIGTEMQRQWFDFKESFSLSKKKVRLKEQIINRIQIPETHFFFLFLEEELIAVGLGVSERDYIGVYDVEIHPNHRKKGFGTDFMHCIINWGRKNSLKTLYLQVEKENKGGQHLYKKIGLKTLYNYHYRQKRINHR
jgi:RimJ/RimL family protein N-acetyltransferase